MASQTLQLGQTIQVVDTLTTSTLTATTANLTTAKIGDGTLSLPGLQFSSDANTGLYRVGTDQAALVAGGYAGLEVRKSTGNYANIGMGGSASVSDQYLLLMQRSYSGPIHQQISNSSADAGSGCKDQLVAGAGNNYFECGLFAPATAAPDAYAGGMATLRSSGTTAGIAIIADDVATANIKMYVAGNAAGNEVLRINADKSIQLMQEITTPATPATNTWKIYAKSGGVYVMTDDGVEHQLAYV